MAEVVGLLASIFSITDGACKLVKVVRSAKHAPKEVLAASNEINNLVPLLAHLQEAIAVDEKAGDNLELVQATLDRAVQELAETQAMISRFNHEERPLSGSKRISWLRYRQDISARQANFREIRQQLILLLSTWDLTAGRASRRAVAKIHAAQEDHGQFIRTSHAELALQLQQLFLMLEAQTAEDKGRNCSSIEVGQNEGQEEGQAFSFLPVAVKRCYSGCRCHCHRQWNLNVSNALVATFYGFGRRACLPDCVGAHHHRRAALVYFFPRFLLRRALFLCYKVSRGEPMFSIAVRPVLPIGSDLFAAAERNDISRLTQLILEGISPNALTEHGQTAIGFAITNGHKDATEFLLRAGADVSIASSASMSALDEARQIVIGNPTGDFAQWLKSTIPAVNSLEALEMSTIHEIVLGRRQTCLRTALIACTADINRKDIHGRTPLWWAVTTGNAHAVKILLRHGANADIADSNNYTPLLQSAEIGCVGIMTELLEHGADTRSKTKWGRSLLHLAANHPDPSLIEVLLGRVLGLDIEEKNNNGNTPLVIACLYDHHHVARALITHGADLEFVGYFQCTPLVLALQRRSEKVLSILLRYGADVRVCDTDGNNVLVLAAKSGSVSMLNTLAAGGSLVAIPIDKVNNQGKTATDFIDAKASVEVRNAFNNLMAACRRDVLEIEEEQEQEYFDAVEEQ